MRPRAILEALENRLMESYRGHPARSLDTIPAELPCVAASWNYLKLRNTQIKFR